MAPVVSAVLMGGGMGLSAYSTYQSGEEANKQSKIQQLQYEAESEAVRMSGQDEARLQREGGQGLLSSRITNASAGGGQIDGSKLYIMANSARNVEIDALVIERNYLTQVGRLKQAGRLARYEGQMARRNARIATVAGLAGSAAQLVGMYKPAKKPIGTTQTSSNLNWNKVQTMRYPSTSGNSYIYKGVS
jgi:hypothetical protein